MRRVYSGVRSCLWFSSRNRLVGAPAILESADTSIARISLVMNEGVRTLYLPNVSVEVKGANPAVLPRSLSG